MLNIKSGRTQQSKNSLNHFLTNTRKAIGMKVGIMKKYIKLWFLNLLINMHDQQFLSDK